MWVLQNYLSGNYSHDQCIAYYAEKMVRQGEKDPLGKLSGNYRTVLGKSTREINAKLSGLMKRLHELVKDRIELPHFIKQNHPTSLLKTVKTEGAFVVPVDIVSIILSFVERKTLDIFCRTCKCLYLQKATLIARDSQKLEPLLNAFLEGEDYDELESFLQRCHQSQYKTAVTVRYSLGLWNESRRVAIKALAQKFSLSLQIVIDMCRLEEMKLELRVLFAICPSFHEVRIEHMHRGEQAEELARLVASCKSIKKLTLNSSRFDALQVFVRALQVIASSGTLPSLEAIDIPFTIRLEEPQEFVAHIFSLCALFPEVRSVSFGSNRILLKIDLEPIALPPALETLCLQECELSARSFQKLVSTCTSLKELSVFEYTSLNEKFPQALESLSLRQGDAENLAKFLVNLPRLTRFRAYNLAPAIAEGLLPNSLRLLSLHQCALTATGLQNIVTNLSNLEELTLSEVRLLGTEPLQSHTPLTRIKALDLSFNALPIPLRQLIQLCPNLQKLNLTATPAAFLARLALPATLIELNLEAALRDFPSSALERLLAHLQNLRQITLARCIFQFARRSSPFATISKSVEAIDLSDTTITEEDLKTIFTQCSRLKSICTPAGIPGKKIAQMKLPATLQAIRGTQVDLPSIRLQCTKIW